MVFKNKHGGIFTDRTTRDGSLDGVGPGAYDPQHIHIFPDSKGKTFARSTRPTSRSTDRQAGVGDYSIDREGVNLKTGFTFPTASRDLAPETLLFNDPGPGAYTIKHTIPQLQKFEQDKLDILGLKISLL